MHYTLELLDLNAHLLRVTLTLEPSASPSTLRLPVWIPGSYLIREFSRHVVSIVAHAEKRVGKRISKRAVAVTQVDKNAWEVAACESTVVVTTLVYAHDLSVRTAWLDAERGFVNGTSVFLYYDATANEPCTVDLIAPHDARCANWTVATSLVPVKTKRMAFGRYKADSYDELIDKPISFGTHQVIKFAAHGTPHEFVITGAAAFDSARLARDCKAICETEIALFEPKTRKAPFARYTFMLHCTADSYGGLEHRDSTALIAKRSDLPRVGDGLSDGYVQLLGLISHEYFHSWNVKRIKPQAFAPYDLQRENLTRLLWLFEGFTSYYDDLILLRAGVIDEARYFKLLSKLVSGVLQTPGRLVESVADASFNAWIKLYRADENTPNSTVSYYPKGAMVALAFDLHLRAHSKFNLDDVMRHLWQRYKSGVQGVAEDELPALVKAATGVDLGVLYTQAVHGTKDLAYATLLAPAGVAFDAVPELLPALGMRADATACGVQVKVVLSGGAAECAALAPGDVLVAVGGEQVNRARWEAVKARLPVGKKVSVHFFRDGLLQQTTLVAHKPGIKEWRLWREKPAAAKARAWPEA